MTKSELGRFVEDQDNLRLFQQERLLLDITELMQKTIEETKTRRSELAKKLGLSRGRITQILGGDENLTLRTVADVFTAMGKHLATKTEDVAVEHDNWYSIDGEMAMVIPLPRMAWAVQGLDPTHSCASLAG